MTFSVVDFEIFNNELLDYDRTFYLNYYKKLGTVDSTASMQSFIILSKFGELALKHKELILSKYIEMVKQQKELIGYYLRIVEAGAGNISPAGNIVSILTTVINFINVGSLLAVLGDLQGDFRIYAEKPLLSYISELLQATESVRDNNLQTAYNTLKDSVILPDKIMR